MRSAIGKQAVNSHDVNELSCRYLVPHRWIQRLKDNNIQRNNLWQKADRKILLCDGFTLQLIVHS